MNQSLVRIMCYLILLRCERSAIRGTVLAGQIADLTSLRRGRIAWLVLAGIVRVEYRACRGAVAVRADCVIEDLIHLTKSAVMRAMSTLDTHRMVLHLLANQIGLSESLPHCHWDLSLPQLSLLRSHYSPKPQRIGHLEDCSW